MKTMFENIVKYYEKKPEFVVGGFSIALTSVFLSPHILDRPTIFDIIQLAIPSGMFGAMMEYLTPTYFKFIYPLIAFSSLGFSIGRIYYRIRNEK